MGERYGQALFSERQQVGPTETTVKVDTGVAFLSTSDTTPLAEPDFAFGRYSAGYLSYDTSGTATKTTFSGTWRPRGSYLFLEHSDADTTAAPIGARLSVITSGGLSNFYVGGFSSTIGTTDSALVFGNSDTVTTNGSTSTEGNIALVDRINTWGSDLSTFQDPAYEVNPTSNTSQLYSGFWDIQMASAGAVNTTYTDANNYTGYTCTTSDSYALVERISGDRYTFRFDSITPGVFVDAYDFAAGGDGSVSIGAYDTFDAVWLESANSTSTSTTGAAGDAAFSSTPFGSTWAWPSIGTIQVADAAFETGQFGIASTLDEVYKNQSYGHSFNWRQGINFDVGTADGNDINLATSWAFSNFFWGDGPVRYAGDNPTISGSVKSGWSIPNKFEPSLTTDFTPTGLEETIYALNTIKSVFSVGTIAAVGTDFYLGVKALGKLFEGSADSNYLNTNVFTNGLDDVDTWNFTAPLDSKGNPFIDTTDFADYSDKDSELYDTFKLDGDKLSLDRSIGAQIHYQKGDFFDYWEDTKGTSFTSHSFDDDGSVEKSEYANTENFSQIGTNIDVSMVGVDLSSTAIGYHDVTTDHQINIGISAVGTSVDLNVLGAKTTFGHNAPSKIGVDAMKVSGTDLTVGQFKAGLKITALTSADKTKVDKNKTTLVGALTETNMNLLTCVSRLFGGEFEQKQSTNKLTAGTAHVKNTLLKARLNSLLEVKSTGVKGSLSALCAEAGVVRASATGLANGTSPEPAPAEQHESVSEPEEQSSVAKEPAEEESEQADNKLSTAEVRKGEHESKQTNTDTQYDEAAWRAWAAGG